MTLYRMNANNIIKKINNRIKLFRYHLKYSNFIEALRALIIKKDYKYYVHLKSKKYTMELAEYYYRKTGNILDINQPRTFNEKIQWIKLFDNSDLKTKLTDKYLVREWIKGKIGEEYLIPLVGVWDKFDDIDFERMPDKFALKANHGSGWNIIVDNKENFDVKEAKKKFDVWLQENYAFQSGFELQYKEIQPKIIAEKYIENANNDLYDYKIYCFNGNPKYIQLIKSRFSTEEMAFYNLEWEKQNFNRDGVKDIITKEEPPKKLKEMIEKAKILSKDFLFVRVDFYEVENHLYFGEMTFTPSSGFGIWKPNSIDEKLGKYLKIPNNKSKEG